MIAAQYEKTGNQLSANGWNGLVDATRRSMVGISDGMLMDQSPMGGTTLTQVRQMRPIRAKSESMFIPFTLRAVNIGTVQHPNWKKIFYFPKFACDIIGGWAECDNEKFVGEQMWAKSGDWYYIADSTGNAGQAHIPEQEDVETVYLHVLKAVDGNEEIRSAIVTNSQLIPEDFNGYETDCICIGKFSCPTASEIGSGIAPRVLEQYVSGQVQVYGDIFPLKLTVVNIGTDASPEWVKAFWFSEGSVLYDGDVFANCHNKPYPGYTMGGEGLYFVANPEGSNTQVPLQEDVAYAFLHVKYTGDETEPCIAIVTNDDVTIPAEFEGEEDYCCCIGRFTCPSAAQIGTGIVPAVDQQFISSQVHVGTASSGTRPFALKIEGDNLCVYAPSYCLQIEKTEGPQHSGKQIVIDTEKNTSLGNGWYRVSGSSYNGWVGVQWDWDTGKFFVGGSGQVAYTSKAFRIGSVQEDGSIKQYVSDAVVFSFSEVAGGGGGDTVNITTAQTPGNNRVLRFISKENGIVSLEATPYLLADEIKISFNGLETPASLSDFFGVADDAVAIYGENVLLGMDKSSPDANQWVKTDESGALTTTDEVPAQVIGINGGETEGQKFVKSFRTVDPDTGAVAEGVQEQEFLSAKDVKFVITTPQGDVETDAKVNDVVIPFKDSEGNTHIGLDADTLAIPEDLIDDDYDQILVVPKGLPIAVLETYPNLEVGESPVDKMMPSGGGDSIPSTDPAITLDKTEWTPGDNGYKESYCCRVVKATVGSTFYRYFIFRTRHIGKNGDVVYVGEEYIGFRTRY